MKKHGLSGYIIGRNCIALDYCFELSLNSLAPICNELVFVDSDSSDGTLERIEEMKKLPQFKDKLRVVPYQWTNPNGRVNWLTSWMNHGREFLEYDTQVYLDADEVLAPCGYPLLKKHIGTGKCFWFHRYNFWRDAQHIVPKGHCCADAVARYGPSTMWMPSDEMYCPGQHEGPEPEIRLKGLDDNRLQIFHYGFLRKRDAFFAKSKVVQPALLGCYDDRLVRAEADNTKPWEDFAPFPTPLIEFKGNHPDVGKQWLRERGYSV